METPPLIPLMRDEQHGVFMSGLVNMTLAEYRATINDVSRYVSHREHGYNDRWERHEGSVIGYN